MVKGLLPTQSNQAIYCIFLPLPHHKFMRHNLTEQNVAYGIRILQAETSRTNVNKHFKTKRSIHHRAFQWFQETGWHEWLTACHSMERLFPVTAWRDFFLEFFYKKATSCVCLTAEVWPLKTGTWVSAQLEAVVMRLWYRETDWDS